MTITGIIVAIIIGAIIGVVARLILPGKQNIPIWLTIAVGIVAAILGTLLAQVVGVETTDGIDWIEIVLQIVIAVIGVAIADRLYSGRNRGVTR